MKETWEDDRDPLAALANDDPAPFEAFVARELTTFLGFFRRLGASRPGAEDLVQDLYLKLYQHSETYQRQGRFVAYAFRVARNLWIDRTRRRAGRVDQARGEATEESSVVERLADQGLEEPGAALARREERDRVETALAGLGDSHRLVFELGVVQGLPYHEIGSILDIPVGTVKSRMFHAVRKLQASLGADSPGHGSPRGGTGSGEQAREAGDVA